MRPPRFSTTTLRAMLHGNSGEPPELPFFLTRKPTLVLEARLRASTCSAAGSRRRLAADPLCVCACVSRELSLRKAYVEHLENLTLQKDDEKEALHKDMMQQVAGVYRLHEQVAAQRVAAHTKELQVALPCPARTLVDLQVHTPADLVVQGKTMQRTSASSGHPAKCQLESEAALQCYASNPKNLLACRKMVDALERCAELARQQAVAALPSPK